MLPKFTVHSKNDDFKEREPDTEEESSKSYTHDTGSELGVEESVAQTPKEKRIFWGGYHFSSRKTKQLTKMWNVQI